MKFTIKSLLFALLSLNLSVFAADELNPTMKAAAMIVPSVDFDRATAQEAVAIMHSAEGGMSQGPLLSPSGT